MNKFACESRLDKPFPPNVYNTLSLRKGRLEENDSPTSLKSPKIWLSHNYNDLSMGTVNNKMVETLEMGYTL